MAILKPISGHGNLEANHCRDYMLGIGPWEDKYHGKRCKRITYINMLSDEVCEKNWAQRMDEDRIKQGTNIALNDKKVRTYNQYIFSPDPRDNITIDELDSAIKEWAKRIFQNKFSIVIGYQNDNKNQIQHAHMYVNNVNWCKTDTKRRIGTYVTPQCWEFASQLWQYMCKERGWYSFIEKQENDIALQRQINQGKYQDCIKEKNKKIEQLFDIDENYFKKYYYFNHDIDYSRPYKTAILTNKGIPIKPIFATAEGRRYTKGALKAKEQGKHLWTDDIRNLIEIAYYQTDNLSDFITTLDRYDISVKLTKDKDFIYFHPDNPKSMQVTGRKLGNDYTRNRLLVLYSQAKSNNIKKTTPNPSDYKLLVNKIREIGYTIETKHISYKQNNSQLTIEDVAKAMKICSYLNIWNLEKLNIKKSLFIKNEVDYCLIKNIFQQLYNIEPVRELIENKQPPSPKSKFDIANTPKAKILNSVNRHNKKQEEELNKESSNETLNHKLNSRKNTKKETIKKIQKTNVKKR